MSREAAKILLNVVIRHAGEQDAALAEVEDLCTSEEFNLYKQMIGKLMGAMLLDVISPVIAKYPELKPPELT
jgi:hypothetical protein